MYVVWRSTKAVRVARGPTHAQPCSCLQLPYTFCLLLFRITYPNKPPHKFQTFRPQLLYWPICIKCWKLLLGRTITKYSGCSRTFYVKNMVLILYTWWFKYCWLKQFILEGEREVFINLTSKFLINMLVYIRYNVILDILVLLQVDYY